MFKEDMQKKLGKQKPQINDLQWTGRNCKNSEHKENTAMKNRTIHREKGLKTLRCDACTHEFKLIKVKKHRAGT